MEDDLIILKVEYFSNHWYDFPQNKDKLSGSKQNWYFLKMLMTFNGRKPQNIKCGVSHQTLIWSS